MTGTVQHIKDDRWRVIVYAGIDERSGRERYRSKSFRAEGKQKALKLADPIKTALRNEIDEAEVTRASVRGYVNEWLEQKAQISSPTTIKGYRLICNRINDQFGRMNMVDLTPRLVRNWYAKLGNDGMSTATIAHYHAVLRAICRQAADDGEVVKPATVGVKLAKPEQNEMRLPTDQAMMAIIGHARGDLFVGLWLAFATGMRRGELAALRWSDLHGRELRVQRALIEADGTVSVKSTKGKRGRRVALDDATMRLLAGHRRAQVAAAEMLGTHLAKDADRAVLANLMVDATGQTPYPPTWLSHGWAQTCRTAGVTGVRLHDARHAHATSLLAAGVPVMDVSARLGHAQVSVTLNTYAHADRARDRAAARVIGRAMKALPSP